MDISIPCKATADYRNPQQKQVKDTPEKRESRIRLYQWRAENGLDIFTGQPHKRG